MAEVFHRPAQIGEGSLLTAQLGHTYLTYGGWFIPQAAAYLLGTIRMLGAGDDDLHFVESPTSVAHLSDSISETIYEV